MGCICSKDSSNKDRADEYEKEKEKESNKSSVQLVAPSVSTTQLDNSSGTEVSVPRMVNSSSQAIRGPVKVASEEKIKHLDAAASQHQRRMTVSCVEEKMPMMSRILSVQHIAGEQVDSGWPIWLSSVAAEAIKGWVPRRADSFEKLDQVSFKRSLRHATLFFINVSTNLHASECCVCRLDKGLIAVCTKLVILRLVKLWL